MTDPFRICLFGAAPDTGNMGVTALCYSVLRAMEVREPGARLVVFDHGRGCRQEGIALGGRTVQIVRRGAVSTRRYYRPESLWNMRVSGWMGGGWNAGLREVQGADGVLDISGGDSFTDLYGPERFNAVMHPKRLALEQARPLILLPQTYGPFRRRDAHRAAASIVRRAVMCWARDERSFDVLRELAGDTFDPHRHRCGVDVAFLLPQREPAAADVDAVRTWLDASRTAPVAGVNVSGLIWNDPGKARAQYGLRADYREVILGLVRQLLARSDARILLVPHVLTPPGHYESDADACEGVRREVSQAAGSRVAVLPARFDPCELKWFIAQTDWFCGTRMHSTIAGLSCGVPTAAVAYSVKTRGVFDTCGQGEHVTDPRELGSDECVESLWQSWCSRDLARARLRQRLPDVLARAELQMDVVMDEVRSARRLGLVGAA